MTKAEANRILREIEASSSNELESALAFSNAERGKNKRIGTAVGGVAGAIAGAVTGKTPLQMLLRGIVGGTIGGAAGYGGGSVVGGKSRKRIYDEIKRRKDERVSDLLARLGGDASYELQRDIAKKRSGIQSNGTDYGVYVRGSGSYSEDDRIPLKTDEDGRPVLSLLFSGINSRILDGGKSSAKSKDAAVFYNKNRNKFSDVQANSIFDDPVVADAYIDKIVAKIMSNREKTGKYPRVRVVGYSAGGRGIVNFLKKMRERDPQFRADEIIGIDPYQYPWEGIPRSLRDPSNPAADKIVYSRLADKYTGSSSKGLKRINDVINNTLASLTGKKLNGIAANTVVENHVPGVAHTDSEAMYNSAMGVLAKLKSENTKKGQ